MFLSNAAIVRGLVVCAVFASGCTTDRVYDLTQEGDAAAPADPSPGDTDVGLVQPASFTTEEWLKSDPRVRDTADITVHGGTATYRDRSYKSAGTFRVPVERASNRLILNFGDGYIWNNRYSREHTLEIIAPGTDGSCYRVESRGVGASGKAYRTEGLCR